MFFVNEKLIRIFNDVFVMIITEVYISVIREQPIICSQYTDSQHFVLEVNLKNHCVIPPNVIIRYMPVFRVYNTDASYFHKLFSKL